MNRDQKAVAIAEIAAHIKESDAIFAVDYRGITVEQVAELRAKLRDADATFKVVKNSLTERAADEVGAEHLKALPVRADRADLRARRRRDGREGDRRLRPRDPAAAVQGRHDGRRRRSTIDQIRSLSRLPSREVLYGQLVGIVASPVTGLVRSLSALIGGLAVGARPGAREEGVRGDPGRRGARAEAPAAEAPAAEAPAAEAPARGGRDGGR